MRSTTMVLFWMTWLAFALSAPLVSAAGQLSVGVQGSWASQFHLGVGARADVDLGRVGRGLGVMASFDQFFPVRPYGADTRRWVANLSLTYEFRLSRAHLGPYLGAGLTVSQFTASLRVFGVRVKGGEMQTAPSLVGGANLRLGRARPFLEGRLVLGDQTGFVAAMGVRFQVRGE